MNKKLSPGNMTILIAGVVIFLASFLAFWKISIGGFSKSYNAWSSDAWLLGNATIPAFLGLIMAAEVALTTFANVKFPPRLLGFSWNQIHLALGAQATVMMIMWLITSNHGFDFGIGFFLMLLAAVALFVGAIIRDRETATTY